MGRVQSWREGKPDLAACLLPKPKHFGETTLLGTAGHATSLVGFGPSRDIRSPREVSPSAAAVLRPLSAHLPGSFTQIADFFGSLRLFQGDADGKHAVARLTEAARF